MFANFLIYLNICSIIPTNFKITILILNSKTGPLEEAIRKTVIKEGIHPDRAD
jgi:hypothetical protein